MAKRKKKEPDASDEVLPEHWDVLALAELVLHVAERSTAAELTEWAGRFGLQAGDRRGVADHESTVARLLLLYLQAPDSRLHLADHLNVVQAAQRRWPPPTELLEHEAIFDRARAVVEVDGIEVKKPLSNIEIEYLEKGLALQEEAGESGEDADAFEQIKVDARRHAMETFGLVERSGPPRETRPDPWLPPHRGGWDKIPEVAHPGPMQSFMSLVGDELPWGLDDEPWERPRGKWIQAGRLRRALNKPGNVKPTELDHLGILNPVSRARALFTGAAVPTGMRLLCLRLVAGDDDEEWVTALKGDEVEPDGVLDVLTEAVVWLKSAGADAAEALVEVFELLRAVGGDPSHERAAYGVVAKAYGYPREFPMLDPPAARNWAESDLSIHDVTAIGGWTDNKQERWLLYDTLRRLKGSMDDTKRVRFPSVWLHESNPQKCPERLPRASSKLYQRILPILDAQVWREQGGHSAGRYASVYWVTYDFHQDDGTVVDDQVEELWGTPYGAAKRSKE